MLLLPDALGGASWIAPLLGLLGQERAVRACDGVDKKTAV
jgi:hypothetical protein